MRNGRGPQLTEGQWKFAGRVVLLVILGVAYELHNPGTIHAMVGAALEGIGILANLPDTIAALNNDIANMDVNITELAQAGEEVNKVAQATNPMIIEAIQDFFDFKNMFGGLEQ